MKKLFTVTIFLFVSGCSHLDILSSLGLSKSNISYKEINDVQAELSWSSDIGEPRDYKTAVLQPVFSNGISVHARRYWVVIFHSRPQRC